jgi:hypothetical protein
MKKVIVMILSVLMVFGVSVSEALVNSCPQIRSDTQKSRTLVAPRNKRIRPGKSGVNTNRTVGPYTGRKSANGGMQK